jgi:hypothetical protein
MVEHDLRTCHITSVETLNPGVPKISLCLVISELMWLPELYRAAHAPLKCFKTRATHDRSVSPYGNSL